MDQTLQDALNRFLLSLLSDVEKGATFAKQQAPLIVQEKLWFDATMAALWVVIATVGFVSYAVKWRALYRAMVWSWDTNTNPLAGIGGPFVIVGAVIGCPIVWIANIHTLLNIWLAPRLYIIEWLRGYR